MRKLFLFVLIGFIFSITYALNFDPARAQHLDSRDNGGKAAQRTVDDSQLETDHFSIAKIQRSSIQNRESRTSASVPGDTSPPLREMVQVPTGRSGNIFSGKS